MSTFAARIAGDRKDLVLWLTIQGIERVFSERILGTPEGFTSFVDDTLGEARTVSACIPVGGISLGESFIDLEALSEKGGSLSVRLKQPHGSTVLVDTFQAMRRRRTYLTANASSSETELEMADTSGFGAVFDEVTFFVGGETVIGTIASATQIGSCTRARYGSRSQEHLGNSGEGSAVYDAAPAFLGRRVKLYGSFVNEDGETSADLTALLGTFSIEQSPRFVDGTTVELSCGPLIDEYMNRRVYIGARDVNVIEGSFEDVASQNVMVFQTEVQRSVEVLVTDNAFVMIVDDVGAMSIHRLHDVPSTRDAIHLLKTHEIVTMTPSAILVRIQRARQVALVHNLAEILCSFVGDGENGVHDVLPGLARDTFTAELGFQMGAGIYEDEVEIDSLPTSTTGYLLDDTAALGDVIREWAFLSDSFCYCTAAGKLAFKRMSPIGETPDISIDESVLIASAPPSVIVDETSIYPMVQIAGNWHPGRREYMYKETHADAELLKRYPQFHEVRRFEFKSLGVDSPNIITRTTPLSYEQVAEIGRRLQRADDAGRLICTVACSLAMSGLSLGDVVGLGFDAPNLRGGSVRDSIARVIGRRINFDSGRVDLTLQVLERLFVFAPTSVISGIASFGGGTGTTISLVLDDPASSATPGNAFPAGMSVDIWDVSAATFQTRTVQTAGDTSIVVTPAVTGTPEADVDFVTVSARGTNSAVAEGASGHTEADFFFYEEDPLADPDDNDARRWR